MARSAKHGFTKIELLVVMGIVGVLASLAVPAVGGAKRKSHQVICLSNLREFGLAVAMYADDFVELPPNVQRLVDQAYLPVPSALLCLEDPTRNWGGIYQEASRRVIAPDEPPERVQYSYLHNLRWDRWLMADLVRTGNSAGLAACQLHGRRTGLGVTSSIADYEGLVLRLQFDGAVVRRKIFWKRQGPLTIADPWRFFSDEPQLARAKS